MDGRKHRVGYPDWNNAGCKTILVNGHSKVQPNHNVRNMIEAVNIIIGEDK